MDFKEFDAYLYDIELDGKLVGDQGDEWFDTEEEATEDAEEYIRTELVSEYNRPFEDFVIECYVGTVVE